ncbi:MAG: glycoside hydrolase family 3 C-terminal domain-containing protein [Clostridia bacterium]|nr:glycoside hydrolase family 3 C-terminal domain-containing protein [Clostridia bacterium]MBP3360241.1 glycoside hydrolase family 3 C-terminal domain-containing protein [Clostridia bacterium]
MKKNVQSLIKQMTTKEKIMFLEGAASMDTAACERLGIPAITFADGPLGVRIEDGEEENCTCFPCGSAMAATWNDAVIEKMGAALGEDCIEHKKDAILGPAINIKRTPVCGRNFEYFSEDPYLVGKIAAAYIRGVQKLGVGTCVKHFAANNQETDRGGVSVEVDERTLRDIYLKPFEIAVKEANPTSLMCAYNRVNGMLCSENKHLMKDILRDDWGYGGIMVSDWHAVKNPAYSLKNGLDLQMPHADITKPSIENALKAGEISEAEIDAAISRLIDFAVNVKRSEISYNRDRLHEIAREVSRESVVLLKNDNNLLPLTPEKCKEIVVIGEYAVKPVFRGMGSARVYPHPEYVDIPLDCIKKNLGESVKVTYVEGYSSALETRSIFDFMPARIPEAEEIKSADAVIVFMGTQEGLDTEGADRPSGGIDPYYTAYLERITSLNKNVVVVLENGSGITAHVWHTLVPAVAEMWMGGEGGGKAIADVLCGLVSPCGKLPETFAKKLRCDIDFPGDGYKVLYDEKWAVGYRYYDMHTGEIAFPFGHGLSYTDFEYSDLNIKAKGDDIKISLKIKNIGTFPGKEIVQIYAKSARSYVSRPEKELIAYYKTKEIEPGGTETAEIVVPKSNLAYFNTTLKKRVIEPGRYIIYAAASSQDLRLFSEYIHSADDFPYTIDTVTETIVG